MYFCDFRLVFLQGRRVFSRVLLAFLSGWCGTWDLLSGSLRLSLSSSRSVWLRLWLTFAILFFDSNCDRLLLLFGVRHFRTFLSLPLLRVGLFQSTALAHLLPASFLSSVLDFGGASCRLLLRQALSQILWHYVPRGKFFPPDNGPCPSPGAVLTAGA